MHRRSSRFIPRATLLAGIASIYPIAHSIGYERSYIPLVLDGLTRDAQTGIHPPRSAQRTGGTTVYTTRTIAASSNDRTIGGKVQRSYQFSQEEERAFAGNNQLGIFPDKAEACTNRPITFPHRYRNRPSPYPQNRTKQKRPTASAYPASHRDNPDHRHNKRTGDFHQTESEPDSS
mgnify:CR=1 FL=1